jgi:hypothetical protein
MLSLSLLGGDVLHGRLRFRLDFPPVLPCSHQHGKKAKNRLIDEGNRIRNEEVDGEEDQQQDEEIREPQSRSEAPDEIRALIFVNDCHAVMIIDTKPGGKLLQPPGSITIREVAGSRSYVGDQMSRMETHLVYRKMRSLLRLMLGLRQEKTMMNRIGQEILETPVKGMNLVGQTLAHQLESGPTLLVFLRHFG